MDAPQKTKGQLFKEKHGYSKTTKRLLKKHGLSDPEELKPLRKARKEKEKKIRKKKHADAAAYRRAHGKLRKNHKGRPKGKGGKTIPKPAAKAVSEAK